MFIDARPYGFPFDQKLDPAKTALLVIDMQVDFLSPDGNFAKQGYDPAPLRGIITPLNRVIAAARPSCEPIKSLQLSAPNFHT